jgi:magnesium chelatase subunit D
MRAPIYAYRLAKTFATLRAAQQVDEEDIGRAARLVLTPRAKSVPHLDSGNPTNPDESNASPSPEDLPSNHLDQSPPPHSNADEGQQTSEAQDLSKSTQPDTHEQDEMSDKSQIEALETSVIEAALATLPPDLLSQLKQGKSSSNKGAHGRVGELKRSNKNGRPLPPIKGKPSNGNRLHVLATLTHAAPRQKLRTQCPQEHSSHSHHEKKFRVKILSDDFHIQRFSKKSESCTIFCLDASGSAALERLAEAKGAVELLLKDSYARRDNICVISFRDRAAQVQLPPTRSLVRAKKNLQSLPGGGGTPLADAIKLAMSTALQVRSQGMTPSLIVLSDGRANVTLEGEGSRAVAKSQALKLAEQWRATQIQSVWLDTSPRSDPQAQEVAQVMGAKYIPLPLANSQNMANAVKQSRSV